MNRNHGIGAITTGAATWPELASPADLASNAVILVDRELSAMEGAAA